MELTPSKQASNGSKVNFRYSPTDAHGIKSIYGTPPKNSVMPFGNSGLGYVLESMGGQDEFHPAYGRPGEAFTVDPPYRLRIFKIAPLNKLITIPAGDFAYYQAWTLKIYTANFANDLVVQMGSCELSTTDVPMGEYQVSERSNIGYVSKPVDFNIGLKNCTGTINKVTYAMTPGPGWLDQANGIMKLDPGSVTGLGIQISRDGQPVRFAVDNDLPPPSGSSATYSFTAAYYQTAKKVGIGNASSSLTILISYL